MQQAPLGYDMSLHQQVGEKVIVLEHFEEAYTSEHWLVRGVTVGRESQSVITGLERVR